MQPCSSKKKACLLLTSHTDNDNHKTNWNDKTISLSFLASHLPVILLDVGRYLSVRVRKALSGPSLR